MAKKGRSQQYTLRSSIKLYAEMSARVSVIVHYVSIGTCVMLRRSWECALMSLHRVRWTKYQHALCSHQWIVVINFTKLVHQTEYPNYFGIILEYKTQCKKRANWRCDHSPWSEIKWSTLRDNICGHNVSLNHRKHKRSWHGQDDDHV